MIDDGRRKKNAEAVFDKLVEWSLVGRIIALSYDTCSVNTGQNIGRKLLNITNLS